MTNPKRPEELSEQELRRLLLDKRHSARQKRLERFRRTGRAVLLSPDLPPSALDEWRIQPPVEMQDEGLDGSARRPVRRRWYDGILLSVEILAVLGLVGLVLNWFGLLQTLNQEVSAALLQDTLTPTPLITAVVLPGGHTPPSMPGGARFNEDEIPEHLRPLVQSIANLPLPTPGPAQAMRIQIPAISVDAPVVQGDSWEQLKKGVGQHVDTSNPGQTGNVVLSAHDDVFGEIFRDLDRLQPGELHLGRDGAGAGESRRLRQHRLRQLHRSGEDHRRAVTHRAGPRLAKPYQQVGETLLAPLAVCYSVTWLDSLQGGEKG